MTAAQKEEEPLLALLSAFGGSITRQGIYYRWNVYGARARGVMMTVFWMMTERRQGQIVAALSKH